MQQQTTLSVMLLIEHIFSIIFLFFSIQKLLKAEGKYHFLETVNPLQDGRHWNRLVLAIL